MSCIFCNRTFAICLTLIIGSIAHSASAQDCDERFYRGCQGYGRPPPPPNFPWAPFPQREVAPSPPINSPGMTSPGLPVRPGQIAPDPGPRSDYSALYAQVDGEPFPIPAVRLSDIGAEYLRRAVSYPANEVPGTIVIDPDRKSVV